jgi:hypothetical protein
MSEPMMSVFSGLHAPEHLTGASRICSKKTGGGDQRAPCHKAVEFEWTGKN